MASFNPKTTKPPNYLYIFYDCEASGDDIGHDQIIELAAVVNSRTDPPFDSLCYTDKDISPKTSELTGLTKEDLRDEPRLPKVLEKLLDWVSERVSQATKERGVQCIPVLVAHGGLSLDFPMLMAEVERLGGGYRTVFSHALYHRMETLSLHFGDTYTVCKGLREKEDPVMKGIKKLGQQQLYRTFFREEYDPHRALHDAQALRRLFTESPLSLHLGQLETKSPQEAFKHWKAIQLMPVAMEFKKAKWLVNGKGVYLEHMEQRYRQSPHRFGGYLRSLSLSRESQGYFEIHYAR